MSQKMTLKDYSPAGQKVLMRVDFNVPLDKDRKITDDTRIRAALPSIRHIIGRRRQRDPDEPPRGGPRARSIRPCRCVRWPTAWPSWWTRRSSSPPIRSAPTPSPRPRICSPGEILLLENLRFNPGETANDPVFAEKLADLAEVYVNDAFGTAHRAHASTVGVTSHFSECRAGLLMQRELHELAGLLEDPPRPFVAVLGGAKVAGKVEVILNLLDKVDTLLLGGGMIFTFFKVHGLNIGNQPAGRGQPGGRREITEKAKSSRAPGGPARGLHRGQRIQRHRRPADLSGDRYPRPVDGARHRSGDSRPVPRDPRRCPVDFLERSHGRVRDCLLSPPAPGRWPRPWPWPRTPGQSASSVAVTAWRRSTSSGWRTGSATSPPEAGPPWNSWPAGNCLESPL